VGVLVCRQAVAAGLLQDLATSQQEIATVTVFAGSSVIAVEMLIYPHTTVHVGHNS